MGRETNDCDNWDFTPESLDDYLAKFWFGARKNSKDDGEDEEDDANLSSAVYSANSIKNFRYALNRIIKKKCNGLDVTSKDNPVFNKSQTAFWNTIKELKKEGKAETMQKSEIIEDGKL